MNLNQLISFVSVIELQSLTKAARKLHLTQPAVTKHIKALEESFGIRLIERGAEAKPTPEGLILYKYTKSIIELLDQAENEMHMLSDNVIGSLTVGASTIPGQYLMPKILGLFKQKFPQTELSLEISDTEQVIHKLLDEEILVGAIGSKVNHPKLFLKEFYKDTLVFIASPNSKFSQQKEIRIQDIQNYDLIWREKGSGTRKAAEELLRQHGLDIQKLNVVMELNSTEAIITAVEANLGIALVSKCAAQRSLDNQKLVLLDIGTPLERMLYLVTLKQHLKRKLISTFISEAENYNNM